VTRTVSIQLNLVGGHTRTLKLAEDAPQLRQLFTALADPSGAPLVQLPIEGGEAALSFPAANLVSVITEPPVVVRLEHDEHATTSGAEQRSATSRARYLVVDDFLTPDERRELYDWTVANERRFKPGAVTSDDPSYRHNRVIVDFGRTPHSKLIENRLLIYYPLFIRRLDLALEPLKRVESQLTAGNDGDYFRAHADGGADRGNGSRYLTCVYYFFRRPRGFAGGDLRLYDSASEGEGLVLSDSFRDIDAIDNRLVVFPSDAIHEVLPIRCPSGAFTDSRFAVTGWLHRTSDPEPEATLGWGHFRCGAVSTSSAGPSGVGGGS
jgi:Rps23 Pro-64 3,4-dihydroxylase Tpa1-like proline 4-hydroxylase